MNPKPENPLAIDPLRRVFAPIERVTRSGVTMLSTTDHEPYFRANDGSIRRVNVKVNGKLARKLRRMRHTA